MVMFTMSYSSHPFMAAMIVRSIDQVLSSGRVDGKIKDTSNIEQYITLIHT